MFCKVIDGHSDIRWSVGLFFSLSLGMNRLDSMNFPLRFDHRDPLSSVRFVFQMSSPAAQQFLLLAKSVRGNAAVDLTTRLLEHDDIFGFDEFLRLETFVSSLKKDHPQVLATLELFAYGTLKDYESNRSNFTSLTPLGRRKLQLLTLASLAAHARILS